MNDIHNHMIMIMLCRVGLLDPRPTSRTSWWSWSRMPRFVSVPDFKMSSVRFGSVRFGSEIDIGSKHVIGLVRFGSENKISRFDAVRPALLERVMVRSGSVRFGSAFGSGRFRNFTVRFGSAGSVRFLTPSWYFTDQKTRVSWTREHRELFVWTVSRPPKPLSQKLYRYNSVAQQ